MNAYIILVKYRNRYFAAVDPTFTLAVFDTAEAAEAMVQRQLDTVNPSEEDLSEFKFALYTVTSVEQRRRRK